MRYEHAQIIDLLSAGRIDAQEAERLLALTGLSLTLTQRLASWLPLLGTAAVVLFQNRAVLAAAVHFLALRAAELSMLNQLLLP